MKANVFRYMKEQPLQYETVLPVELCIQQIISQPWTYGPDSLNELWYKCEKISESNLLVTFTGGRFRKIMRTQYLLVFSRHGENTNITMTFQKEMFGMPPMTHILDIDCFMEKKIGALRKSRWGIF